MGDRISREEFARRVHDQLRYALDNDLLTNDQMRELIKILGPVAERAKHGGPRAAEVERN
jgi:hypothetical protein